MTDSPWFWVLVFSLFGVGALIAIGGKYEQRQTGIERKFQARQQIMRDRAAGKLPGDRKAGTRRELTAPEDSTVPSDQAGVAATDRFAQPGTNLIPLWPIYLVLSVVASFSAAMLYRSYGGVEPRANRTASEEEH